MPATVSPGDQLTINWTAPAGSSSTDWIGLFLVGDDNTAPVWWMYTNGAPSGMFDLTAPGSGQYEFRYLLNDSYVDAAQSNPVAVR